MKKILFALKQNKPCRVVARFGAAKLITNEKGQFELRGGSKGEQIEAREWASLFQHDAVI